MLSAVPGRLRARSRGGGWGFRIWEMVVLNGGLDWIFMVFQWIPMEAIIIFTIIHPFYGHFMAMEKMMIIGHPL